MRQPKQRRYEFYQHRDPMFRVRSVFPASPIFWLVQQRNTWRMKFAKASGENGLDEMIERARHSHPVGNLVKRGKSYAILEPSDK